MKAAFAVVCATMVMCAACSAEEAKPAATAAPKTEAEKVSYALGYMNGKGMKRQDLKVDVAAFKKGLETGKNATPAQLSEAIGIITANGLGEQNVEYNADLFAAGLAAGFDGGKAAMTEDEMQETMKSFQVSMREKMQKKAEEEQAVEGKKNTEAGVKFLEENKAKEGVKVTKSGLQYKVVKEGKGPMPKETDKVKVHYKGTLIDGTKFDSSYDRNEPSEFGVTDVIKGWTEALLLMPVGSKWELVIPSELGYGEKGAGGEIGPNAVLCFEVELVEIVKEEAGKGAMTPEFPVPGK